MGVGEGVITFLTGVFTGDWSMAWEGIKKIAMSVVGGIIETVENMVAAIEDAVARIRGQEGTAQKTLQEQRAAKKREELREQAISSGRYSRETADRVGQVNADYNPGEEPLGTNALGTNFWRGGLTWIHEQGPEIVYLPTGAKVIPHSKSLMQEYNRGLADGMAILPSVSMPTVSTFPNVSNLDTPSGQPVRDAMGNIKEVTIPEYNQIKPNDSETVRSAKQEAQEKIYMDSRERVEREVVQAAPLGASTQTVQSTAEGGSYQPGREGNPQEATRSPGEGTGWPQSILRGGEDRQGEKALPQAKESARPSIEVFAAEPKRDAQGNIQGINIPEYNRIKPSDSEAVKAAKLEAQEKVYMQVAPLGASTQTESTAEGGSYQPGREGNPQEATRSPEEGTGWPQSILRGGEDRQGEKALPQAKESTRQENGAQQAAITIRESAPAPAAESIQPKESSSADAPTSAHMETAGTGRAAEPSRIVPTGQGNAQSNFKSQEQPKPQQNITFSINIPKLADEIYVREKTDIENIARQLVFQIRGQAQNMIRGAVR